MTSKQIYFEAFMEHWRHIVNLIKCDNDFKSAEAITRHIDVMTSIIRNECDGNNTSLDAILNYCANNSIFLKIFIRFNRQNLSGNMLEHGMYAQLKMYHTLLNCLPTSHLEHNHLLSPLFHLLKECSLGESYLIRHLTVKILYQLTVLVTREPQLLEFVKKISDQEFNESFHFVRLIIFFINKEKDIGRLSQEAMLLLFIYSKDKDSELVDYVCHKADFSATLVSGLRELYFSLPKKFDNLSDDWQQITPDFILTVPELQNLLQLLDFCSVILKMAHPSIQADILDYLQTGFLSLVIGPSLHEAAQDENICSTAYLELFLRRLHHESLTKMFLRFLLTEKRDNVVILDTLIGRLDSVTMLGVITLSLFRTILSFHCEDVMFHLILRYLVPCTHLLRHNWGCKDMKASTEDLTRSVKGNQSVGTLAQIKNTDGRFNEDFSNSVDQFLHLSFSYSGANKDNEEMKAMISAGNVTSNNFRTILSSFYSYLNSAALYVNRRILATNSWTFNYDGIYPSPQVFTDIEGYSGSRINYSFISKESDTCNNVDPSLSRDHKHDKLQEGLVLFTDNDRVRHAFDKVLVSDPSPEPLDHYRSKASQLCDLSPLTKDIYKLNYFPSDNEVICKNTDGVPEYRDEMETCSTELDSEILQINLDRFLRLSDENCELSDFLISLDLLEVRDCIDWDIDWTQVTDLLAEHNAEYVVNEFGSLDSSTSSNNSVLSDLWVKKDHVTKEQLFQNRLESFEKSVYKYPASSSLSITLGPFLTTLFQRLRSMPSNSVFTNLLVTGIIADIAAYPHPLIKNLILDNDIILYPAIDKLYDIVVEIKDRLITESLDIPNWETVLCNAYDYLYSRVERTSDCSTSARKPSLTAQTMPTSKYNFQKNLHFFSIRKKVVEDSQYRFPIVNISDARAAGINETKAQQIRNLAYCWVIFDEFCKEIASLCQEHTQHCFF